MSRIILAATIIIIYILGWTSYYFVATWEPIRVEVVMPPVESDSWMNVKYSNPLSMPP